MLDMINSKKHLFIITFLLVFFSRICISYAFDVNAAEALKEIEGLFKQPPQQRKISKEQTELFIKRAERNNSEMRICVSIALAFAEDSNSLEILKRLSTDQDESVKGAASYALKIRHISGRKPDEILRNLCFYLGKSDNEMEKIFLANRMWVDFKEEAMYTILDSMQSEPNDHMNFYRCDLLYYLSQSDNPEILKEGLKLDWKKDLSETLPESLSYLLGSITPGRKKSTVENTVIIIQRNIREKLGLN